MKRQCGSSLLEMLVSMGVLSLMLTVLFSIFSMGSSSFHLAIVRQGLQSEGRKVGSVLRKDLLGSDFLTVAISNSPNLTATLADGTQASVQRDAIVMCTLADYAEPASYDPNTGLPNWNRYIVYAATQELPSGRLIREILELSPAVPGRIPSPDVIKLPLPEPPASPLSGTTVVGWSTMSDHVLDMRISTFQSDQSVKVSVKLRDFGVHTGGTKASDDVFEAVFDTKPSNSWPSS